MWDVTDVAQEDGKTLKVALNALETAVNTIRFILFPLVRLVAIAALYTSSKLSIWCPSQPTSCNPLFLQIPVLLNRYPFFDVRDFKGFVILHEGFSTLPDR